MKQYLDILTEILESPYSVDKDTRTGIKTKSLTGVQFKHDMRDGFPLLTTKFVSLKNVAIELEFFIKGYSDKKWLQNRGCHIWDEWANPDIVNKELDYWSQKSGIEHVSDGSYYHTQKRIELQKEINDLGRIYGVQWRNWMTNIPILKNGMITDEFKTHDQLLDIINRAKRDPLDRRLIVSAWKPDEMEIVDNRTDDDLYEDYLKYMEHKLLNKEEFLEKLRVDEEFNKKFGRKSTKHSQMALPPCHYSWQILSDGSYLDLIFNIRSWDYFLGGPYNIASYGLLLLLLSTELNLTPRLLIGNGGDVHLYENHMDQVNLQLTRQPYELPTVNIINFKSIFEWTYKDFSIYNYHSHDAIKAPIAI